MTVIGNLINDPETGVGKKTGVAWASFRLACNGSWRDANRRGDASGEVHKWTD